MDDVKGEITDNEKLQYEPVTEAVSKSKELVDLYQEIIKKPSIQGTIISDYISKQPVGSVCYS